MSLRKSILALAVGTALLPVAGASAETLVPAERAEITDWKAVYARIEARDRVPARARIGGTLVELGVAEGDRVTEGQPLARISDEKLEFRIGAIDAQLEALRAQLENARTELARGEELLKRGVTTTQRLDALRTQVDVLSNQITATEADRRVVEQQLAEGVVRAPTTGVVLDVPVTRGAVVMPGEAVARIGGGGIFLRLAVPERHAHTLKEGDTIRIETGTSGAEGRLGKVYPQIENGRVIADVEVKGLSERFVDARVLVRLPVGRHWAILAPQGALETRFGVDFLTVQGPEGPERRTVVPGATVTRDGRALVEILTGLRAGEMVVTGND